MKIFDEAKDTINFDMETRVTTLVTTIGASTDLVSEGTRRLLVNGAYWCLGMEDTIQPNNSVAFVGPYNPVTFRFGGYRKGVKPADLEGWDTPILGEK